MAEKYDAIVIGTGQFGPSLAARFASEGLKTAVLERKLFWGHLRQRWLHPDQDLGGERPRRPHGSPRGGLRRCYRQSDQGRHETCQGSQR